MAEIRLNDVAYPLVGAEDAWRVVSQSEVLTDLWDEWVEMGHPRRFRGGYYCGGGFDPTSGVLRLSPYYHADNNNQLSTGYGYFFQGSGVSASTLTEQVKEDSTDTVQDDPLLVGAVTLNVTDGTLFGIGQTITIENEDILITVVAANALTIIRGYNGTTAAEHAQTTAIYYARNSSKRNLGTSLKFKQRVTAGNSDRLIIFTVTSNTVSSWGASVTCAGLPMSMLGGIVGGSVKTYAWYLVAPPTGTLEIVMSTSRSIRAIATASVWHGVDQATPFGTAVTATGTSTDPAVFVSTGAGEGIIFAGGAIDGPTLSDFGTDGVERVDLQYSGAVATHFVGVQDGGDGGTIDPLLSASKNWTILGVSIKPVSTTAYPYMYCADGDKIFKYTYDSGAGLAEVVAESGTADSAAAATLVDANPAGGAWGDDDWNNHLIEITGGTGVGQRRAITDTTDAGDVLAIAPNWDVTPDNTSTYVIYASQHVASGVAGRPLCCLGVWYVPMGAGANTRRLKTVGSAEDVWEDAGFKALHLTTYQVGPQAGFARAYDTNKVDISYETTELDAASWAGDAFPVGDTSTAITDINEISGELIVSKEDVAYQFDMEGTSRPIGTFKNRGYVDADNGRGTKVWLDRAYIPSNQGLDRYVIGQRIMGVGINRIVGFRDVPGITSPRSRRHAYVEAVGHSIYSQLNGGELTGLMHARHREAGDPIGGELVWNHVLEIPLSKGMWVDSQNNLWIKGASVAEADRDIRVIELDDNGGLQKALRRGQASSEHEIWFDETNFMHPDETKQFASLMIETSQWATGASLQLTIYRDDGSVEDVGDPITSATLTELTWTVGTDDTGRRGRLRLVLTTDDTYAPLTSDPLILHVTAKARTPVIYEGTIDASPEALGGSPYDAAETLKMLRRLVSAGFKDVGEPGVEATFEGEIVAVREKMVQRGDKQGAYEISVLVRRWVTA